MTNSLAYAGPLDARQLPFADRRTSMLVVGVLLLIMGAVSGCIGIASPVGMLLASTIPPPRGATRPAPFDFDWRTAASASFTYAAIATMWISIGIGAVRLRRWVRPLVLIVGWTWLVTGAVGLLYWVVIFPSAMTAMTAAAPPGTVAPPTGALRVIFWGMGVFMILLMVVTPAALVWAFARKGVRETLEYFDPRLRWTDRCPTAVLAVSVWLVAAAAGCLMYAVFAVLPLFGRIVAGPAGAAGLVLVAAVFAVLAWQVYRLRPAAWWGALIGVTLWAFNTVWTFSRTGWAEFYRRAGYSQQQTDVMLRYSGGSENGMLWAIGFWTVVWVVYLMYVRRYFWPAPGSDGVIAESTPAPPAEVNPS